MELQDLQNLFANTDPSTQFFDSKSIFSILNVEDAPQSEKDKMLKDFVTEAVQRAIKRVLADPNVDDVLKSDIQRILNSTDNIFKAQEELNSLLPQNFVHYVIEESRMLKLEMSLNNIRETYKMVVASDSIKTEQKEEFKNAVNLAEEAFREGNLNKYKTAYEKYDSLRSSLL